MSSSNPQKSILKKMRIWPKSLLLRFQINGFSRKEWLNALQGLGHELETLGRSTEAEFLALGEKLEGFHRSAGEISRISTSVTALMSGEEIVTAINGFREVVARIEQLQSESRQNAKTLKDVLQTLACLDHQLRSFRETVWTLRVLCVSTRIESARFGQRDIGFNALSDEVEKLAVVIEEKSSHLLTRSGSLSHLIGQVMVRVSELETTQHTQAEVILGKTMASLESLSERYTSSSTGAKDIAGRYDAISRNTGEIVASMQIHDITRQRVEHAKEALDKIVGAKCNGDSTGPGEKAVRETPMSGGPNGQPRFRFGWSGRHGHPNESGIDLRTAGDICGIQAAQLRDARNGLVASVENIRENLRQVAGHVADMSQETENLAGAVNETGKSFLSEVEAGFSSVNSAFSAYAAANRELSSVMDSVSGTLQDMSAYSDDIEGIGAKIRLIALNAIVKASHIDQEGATLAVLAEAIHHLSVETCRLTEKVGETLRSIFSASELLRAGMVADGDGKTTEVARLGETLRSLLDSLHQVNGDIGILLSRIKEEGRNLSEDIQRTVAGVSVHHRVDDKISQVVSRLEEIVGLSCSHHTAAPQSHSAERVRALETAYTMQGEREVHQSVVSVAARTNAKTVSSPLKGAGTTVGEGAEKAEGKADDDSEADLGENVELF